MAKPDLPEIVTGFVAMTEMVAGVRKVHVRVLRSDGHPGLRTLDDPEGVFIRGQELELVRDAGGRLVLRELA